jgi:peptide deformylase
VTGPGVVREIRTLGDPVLRTACDPVTSYDDDLRRLVEDMFASMYAARGVGLAANQIGVGLAVFVYDCPDDDGERHHGTVVNPRVELSDGEDVVADEGCLSVPGLSFATTRRAHAVVSGFDVSGAPVVVDGHGYLARCLQHETDHLAGTVYLDRLTGEERKAALRAVRAAGLV